MRVVRYALAGALLITVGSLRVSGGQPPGPLTPSQLKQRIQKSTPEDLDTYSMRKAMPTTPPAPSEPVYNPVARERSPESVQQLPPGIRQDLIRRQCLIPKYKGDTGSEDAAYTSGHFRSGTSLDYAVVCHIPSRTVQDVLVYSNSKGEWKAELIERGSFDPAPKADKCEATVGVATRQYILVHARAYAPEELKTLPPLDHNGVEVGICEKASIIYYFSKGKWLNLQGAD